MGVAWTTAERAFDESRRTGKPVLFEFHSPH